MSYDPEDLEAQIAATLAPTWDSYWDSGPAAIAAETPESLMLAERAIALYAFTNKVLESAGRQRGAFSEPALVGAGLLREFADGYALASFGWTTLHFERLKVDAGDNNIPLPRRNELEGIVSARGVDDWIESLGYSLARRPAGAADARPREEEVVRDDTGAEGLVSDWGLSLDGYCRAEELRQSPRGRRILFSIRDLLHEAAISNLVLARRWLRWARARMGPDPQAACVVWQLSTQAVFEMSHAESDKALAELHTPTADFLASLLQEEGALEWLGKHGALVPDCLAGGAGT